VSKDAPKPQAKPASHYKTVADLAAIERLAERNLSLSDPWHSGADITALRINSQTEAVLTRLGYTIQRTANSTFLRWR